MAHVISTHPVTSTHLTVRRLEKWQSLWIFGEQSMPLPKLQDGVRHSIRTVNTVHPDPTLRHERASHPIHKFLYYLFYTTYFKLSSQEKEISGTYLNAYSLFWALNKNSKLLLRPQIVLKLLRPPWMGPPGGTIGHSVLRLPLASHPLPSLPLSLLEHLPPHFIFLSVRLINIV